MREQLPRLAGAPKFFVEATSLQWSHRGTLHATLIREAGRVRVICASCGAENDPGRKFCLSCGQRLAVACPSCGSPYGHAVRFCPQCGQSLVSAEAAT